MKMKPYSVMDVARRLGIVQYWHDEPRRLLRFFIRQKGELTIVDVWYTTMTVGTTVNHPRLGRNTLYRKNVSIGLLNRILQYPRLHTHKGYRSRERKKHIW